MIDYLDDSLNFIKEAEKNKTKGNILIHCQVGKSRSAAIVIAYLVKHKNYSLDDAFKYIKKIRGKILPNIGFMMQLRDFEKELLKNKEK